MLFIFRLNTKRLLCFHVKLCAVQKKPKKTIGSNSAFQDNPQFACNPFVRGICSQITRCRSTIQSFYWAFLRSSLNTEDIFIFMKDWILYEDVQALLGCLARVMGTTVGQNWENWIGSPPPISYQQHPRLVYLYASVESRLARALMTVVMLREKREPGPRRSWYVGLSEEDSCRHNLLLTGWYGYFLSDPPLRLEAAPAAHSVHTAAGKIFLMGLMSVFIVFSLFIQQKSLCFLLSDDFSQEGASSFYL